MPVANLPVGFHRFHRDDFVNYQLNRAHSLGFLPRPTVERGAAAVRSHDDVPRVFAALADEAERGGRLAEAASCARLAEFFTPRPSDAQVAAYRRFRELWDRAFLADGLTRHEVPYGQGALPALRLAARGEHAAAPLGTVLFFGGFDSLIEEFTASWSALGDAGWDVIAFDGPGQGGARTLHGVVHTHDWERPVAAVLDHFGLSEAALVGMSMGAWWAVRAAAHEPRITRLVAWAPVYDWLARFPGWVGSFVRWMVARRGFMNVGIRLRMRLFPILRHVVGQATWLSGTSEPADAAQWFLGMNAERQGAERVVAPTLLMVGENDAFQPAVLGRLQARALSNAPVTTRLFTASEHADQHCQMGNLGLANGELARWLATGQVQG